MRSPRGSDSQNQVHLLHAIAVDGRILRIEGDGDTADALAMRLKQMGRVVEFLFTARTQEEFDQKEHTAVQRRQG